MIREQGVVIRTEGRFAWIETQQRTACGSCASAEGCGTSSLASLFERRNRALRVPNPIGAQVGQTVTLGLSEGGLLRAAFLVYILPLLAMIAGGIVARVFGPAGELATVAGSLLGFAAGFFYVRRRGRQMENDPRFQPVLLSIDG